MSLNPPVNKDTPYPFCNQYINQIQQIIGVDIPIHIFWNTLLSDPNQDLYEKAIPSVFFIPQITIFKDLCLDKKNKQALQRIIKKIEIKNTTNNWAADKWVCFKEGVLIFNHQTTTNYGNIEDRSFYLKQLLEQLLYLFYCLKNQFGS